jgi:transposase-like protein
MGMGLLSGVFDLLLGGDAESREEERYQEAYDIIKKNSLSCEKCNGLSPPIHGTNNRYRCVECGRQFVNTNHSLASYYAETVSEKRYNRCINDLKKLK